MECSLLCCSKHGTFKDKCEECLGEQELSVALLNLNRKLIQEKKTKELEIERLKGLIVTAEDQLKETSANKIKFDENSFQAKGVPLSEHLAKLILPDDFFSIITKEDLTIAFMIQVRFIPLTLFCHKCNADMPITYYGWTGYAYFCFTCSAKNKVKNVTCFQNSPLSLEKVLLFVFLWVLGVRDREISNLLEVSHNYLSAVSRKLRQIVGEEFKKSLPVFSGVVEIDEYDFIKRKIEIGKSKVAKKWILIMLERKTKQIYVEYIPERTKAVVVPIIQRMCLPGTIIITRTWAGYGRLEDLGYPHYTYDKRLGFIDPSNKHIHHSTIKNAFTWLKYHIKTKNRVGHHLQEYILEWLWRKRHASSRETEYSNFALFKLVLSLLTKIPRIT